VRTRYLLIMLAIAVLVAATAVGAQSHPGQNPPRLPPGFLDQLVVRVELPTDMAFTPDGQLLVTTQPGMVRVVDRSGHLVRKPALDFRTRVCIERERGMTGIAVDPRFERNRYVYVYYTFKKFGTCPIQSPRGPVNRLSRFTMRSDSTIDPASETPLIDNVPSYGATHNAGDIEFGKDGYIYVGIGDGGRDYAKRSDSSALNAAARDLNVLLGKVVRITKEGGTPPGNPFRGPGTVACARRGVAQRGTVCREIYAWGLRNPWRLAFDPSTPATRFFINDVGENAWEEIDVGGLGADYGWNFREGFCPRSLHARCSPAPRTMTDPIHAYAHRGGCGAITGGAFVPPGTWPSRFQGSYLFGDYDCGKIIELTRRHNRVTTALFDRGVGPGLVSMTFGPGKALYYATYAEGGEIRRITYESARVN
jgi:glucose/arabinose dehydrogenase